jgi:hypothetical protein
MTADHRRAVAEIGVLVALFATGSALVGLVVGGGPGRHEALTAHGAVVTLYGHGLYAGDTWLVGAGNRGQDVAVLLFAVPVLLLALRRYRRGGAVAAAVLTGVLAFFAYLCVSMVFATAQNRLFPVYVASAALACFGLVLAAQRLDVAAVVRALPDRPGRRTLAAYLLAVAAALTAAWLPEMVGTALRGGAAMAVGPYTSAATEALDLGLVVPVAVVAAVLVLHRVDLGRVLALVLLVVNVCVGVLLLGQGIAQLMSGVPLTLADIVVKMATFAALTVWAGALLLRMWLRRPVRGTGAHAASPPP